VEGYGASTYGDAFADAYDRWYGDLPDLAASVSTVVELAGFSGRVLELGVGTGRIALQLADSGLQVIGLDSSSAMLERLRAKDPDGRVTTVHAAMQDLAAVAATQRPPFDAPFDVVLLAYNTLFNLVDDGAQEQCLTAAAELLGPAGRIIVEAFVPDDTSEAGSSIGLRSMTTDEVVLTVAEHHRAAQLISGQFISLDERTGVRLRPWAVRYCTPEQLDELALDAGLDLIERWADFERREFISGCQRHVSIYGVAPQR
jgi:SAM-dependent methyltransferase